MQKLMKALHKNEKGFTLVELMVVVVIIGILVAIAVPIYNAVTARAERSAIEANLRTVDGGIMMLVASEVTPPTTVALAQALLTSSYLQEWPESPGVYTVIGTDATPSTWRAQVVIPVGTAGLTAIETSTLEDLSWRQ